MTAHDEATEAVHTAAGAKLRGLDNIIDSVPLTADCRVLLCSSMADRLAGNKGTPFNPDKEFWGQGVVQIITPLINGFPCTGALARTATSIKAGAVTPLAGYFKGVLKLLLVELPTKTAVKLAAEITGASRNTLYDRALELKREAESE